MEQLLVGVKKEVITPALGYKLLGYTPLQTARFIHDDVYATAFAFETSGVRALLLALDMCYIDELQEEICQTIFEKSGINKENIIVACTHTHSGPHTAWELDKRPNYMQDFLIPLVGKLAAEAVEEMRPAQMGVGVTYSDVGVNRRQITEEGKVVLGQNPAGSWDPEMTVVSFRELNGKPIGNIIHYGCHNTASGRTDMVTRDWCGVMVDRLEEQSGGITAFINGCGGDCGPRLPNGYTIGNMQMAMELGGKAGIDAVRAWRSIKIWENAPLKVVCGPVSLPLDNLGEPEQIEATAYAMGTPEELAKRRGPCLAQYENLLKRAQYVREGNIPPTEEEIAHTMIALGPLVLQPIPFEPFSMITLRIKEHSPFPYTLCVGYANGCRSYFPSMDQLIRGGYEIELFRNYRLIPYADDAEQHYLAGSVKLLRELYEK